MAISSPEMMLVPVLISLCRQPRGQRRIYLTQVDITETTAANLASNTVLITDTQIHSRHLECEAALAASKIEILMSVDEESMSV